MNEVPVLLDAPSPVPTLLLENNRMTDAIWMEIYSQQYYSTNQNIHSAWNISSSHLTRTKHTLEGMHRHTHILSNIVINNTNNPLYLCLST